MKLCIVPLIAAQVFQRVKYSLEFSRHARKPERRDGPTVGNCSDLHCYIRRDATTSFTLEMQGRLCNWWLGARGGPDSCILNGCRCRLWLVGPRSNHLDPDNDLVLYPAVHQAGLGRHTATLTSNESIMLLKVSTRFVRFIQRHIQISNRVSSWWLWEWLLMALL